jgi:hypothetical protein
MGAIVIAATLLRCITGASPQATAKALRWHGAPGTWGMVRVGRLDGSSPDGGIADLSANSRRYNLKRIVRPTVLRLAL